MDERIIGAGTTSRFLLLLALVLVVSTSTWSAIVGGFADYGDRQLMCILAAGVDPDANMFSVIARTQTDAAYLACDNQSSPPGWIVPGVLVLLLGAAVALYWAIPAWKARGRRVVPLEAVDPRGDLRELMAELVATAGLARTPRFVVDPTAATSSAVVFGRLRRYTVCLHGGLLARRSSDPAAFRAVVLHELAHIRSGDVNLTFATVALWRVCLFAVLTPYLAFEAWELFQSRPVEFRFAVVFRARDVLATAFLVVLVYLTRADILRRREIYADLTAARWGAEPAGWHGRKDQRGPVRSAVAAFAEVWRSHPTWDLRRYSLGDPAELFRVHPLSLFLTGSAASIIVSDLGVSSFPPGDAMAWLSTSFASLVAGLTIAAVGTALWRAAAYAVLTGREAPLGLRAGCWLGGGLLVGEVLAGRLSGNQWLPTQPAALLVLPAVAVVVTCWTSQCAQLWIRAWRGRTLRSVTLLGMVATWLVFAFWFLWWQHRGFWFADLPLSILGPQEKLQQLIEVGDGGTLPSAVAGAFTVLVSLDPSVLVWAAAAVAGSAAGLDDPGSRCAPLAAQCAAGAFRTGVARGGSAALPACRARLARGRGGRLGRGRGSTGVPAPPPATRREPEPGTGARRPVVAHRGPGRSDGGDRVRGGYGGRAPGTADRRGRSGNDRPARLGRVVPLRLAGRLPASDERADARMRLAAGRRMVHGEPRVRVRAGCRAVRGRAGGDSRRGRASRYRFGAKQAEGGACAPAHAGPAPRLCRGGVPRDVRRRCGRTGTVSAVRVVLARAA
ncbi:M48 family metalloprotease [Amycolatopsis aidingensis]|uniref:M48 family metalloprotease n=1 Tax=Amycolatopsis aidingensis TaxID=2842453 RepID=UPI001C0D5012|nr:M48 family metalloprotease [Amycolatopsis aidingensis]